MSQVTAFGIYRSRSSTSTSLPEHKDTNLGLLTPTQVRDDPDKQIGESSIA